MKLRFIPLIGGALLVFGCGWHELGRPIGTAIYAVPAPTGVVDALGANATADALALGARCEAADFAACTQVAAIFRDGLEDKPAYDPHSGGGHGDDHGDAPAAEASGEHGAAADAHGDNGHGADAHGDDGHGADAHGGGHAWAVAPNAAKAAELFEVTCQAGWATSCLALGHAYAEGHGVAADPARAHSLMAGACEDGLSEACLDLAAELEHSSGGHAEALALYETACLRNVAAGCVGRDRLVAGH